MKAYWWELRKLVAQMRTYVGFAAMIIAPVAFTIGVRLHSPSAPRPGGEPEDVYLYASLHSGLAIPLVALFFSTLFLAPLVAALVAGDIFAAEDHNHTLKTILTRSTGRGVIFVGKAAATATYVLLLLVVLAITGVVVGGLVFGFHPLQLIMDRLSPGTAGQRLALAFAVYAAPLLALSCLALLLSAVTHNSAGAVVGTLVATMIMQIVQHLPGVSLSVQHWLLTYQFDAWRSAVGTKIDLTPLLRAVWVSFLYGVPFLLIAWRYFSRRDVLV